MYACVRVHGPQDKYSYSRIPAAPRRASKADIIGPLFTNDPNRFLELRTRDSANH